MGVDELVEQAGFLDTGLTHRGEHLSMAGAGPCQRLRQRVNLDLSSDKARQAAC